MTDVKRYLQQIKLYDSHINTKLEEHDRLLEMATRITPTLKDVVVSGGGNQDKLADAAVKLADLEAEIDADIDRYVNAKQEISGVLDGISDPDQLQVLHKRYVQYKTFEQIACDMNMTYRNVCYIHGKGLLAVREIMSNAESFQ